LIARSGLLVPERSNLSCQNMKDNFDWIEFR
jgi:hypothetical protein